MVERLDPTSRALALPIWQGKATASPLGGGITNLNLLVTDANRRAVVRIGKLLEEIDPAHREAFDRMTARKLRGELAEAA